MVNPACDVVVSKDEIECLFFDDILEIKGDSAGELFLVMLNTSASKTAIRVSVANRDNERQRTLMETLKENKVAVPLRGVNKSSTRLRHRHIRGIVLWSSLPVHTNETIPQLCQGVGFRVGHEYILGFWAERLPTISAARQVYEWIAGRNWLQRGIKLFAPEPHDKIIPARQFIPPQELRWMQQHLSYLISHFSQEQCLYVIDVKTAVTRRFEIKEQQSTLCITGPFEPVLEIHQQNGSDKDPFGRSCTSCIARYRVPVKSWVNDSWAWGSDVNPSVAKDIAYAEAIERYCAGHYPSAKLRSGTRDKNNQRVDPYTLMSLDEDQLTQAGLCVFTDGSPAKWVPGIEYPLGDNVEILADLCLYPFHNREDKGPYFWASSSGMAAHRTRDKAIIKAFLELIERDAFMRIWLSHKSPSHIPLEMAPTEIITQARLIRELGFNTELLDITQKTIPSVLVIIHCNNRTPALCCGCASRLSLHDACLAAYQEAETALFGALGESRKDLCSSARDVRLPEHHGELYYNPSNLHHAEFLWSSCEYHAVPEIRTPLSSNQDNLDELTKLAGVSTVYIVDYPCPNPNISVVRLDSPELVPVSFGYGLEPRVEGVEHRKFSFPHPFA